MWRMKYWLPLLCLVVLICFVTFAYNRKPSHQVGLSAFPWSPGEVRSCSFYKGTVEGGTETTGNMHCPVPESYPYPPSTSTS
jgi:hypothetical protein